ncbi:MAG: hypothetical protein LBH24_06145 [Clostridiales bacterium]|jgi:hypothetical protein|nr:hypothetical protein [Clostridiales bacterium]
MTNDTQKKGSGRIAQDRGVLSKEKENKKSTGGFLTRGPAFGKAAIYKFWFAGAVYFFIGWGISNGRLDQLDTAVIIGLAIGLMTDLIINRVLMAIDNKKNKMAAYLMFYHKKFYFLFFNLAYGVILSLAVAFTYHLINFAINVLQNLPEGSAVFGAEPLLFGLFYLLYDLFLVTLRNGVIKLVKTVKSKGSAGV